MHRTNVLSWLQIVMYHFTAPMTGAAGKASTALASMDRLTSFIDATAICGREDSKHVTIQVCNPPTNMTNLLSLLHAASGVGTDALL